jgi:hypothetical protein
MNGLTATLVLLFVAMTTTVIMSGDALIIAGYCGTLILSAFLYGIYKEIQKLVHEREIQKKLKG